MQREPAPHSPAVARRAAAGRAPPPRRRAAALAPTVPAVDGHTVATEPTLAERLLQVPELPGRPRLAPVHGGAVPHQALDRHLLEVPLPVGRVLVGRDPSADVRLDEPSVSPRHVLLEVQPDGVVHAQDLGALNGLAVDGVPVVRAQLNDGNRLDLGEAQLVFRCDPQVDDGGRQGGELGEQQQQRDEGRD